MTLDECMAKAKAMDALLEAAKDVIDSAESNVDELALAINSLAEAVRDGEAAVILATTRPPLPGFQRSLPSDTRLVPASESREGSEKPLPAKVG